MKYTSMVPFKLLSKIIVNFEYTKKSRNTFSNMTTNVCALQIFLSTRKLWNAKNILELLNKYS